MAGGLAAGAGEQDLVRYRHLHEDDQLLWQMAWLNGAVDLRPDYGGRIFRNINTLDMSLGENRHFDLTDGVVVFKPSGLRPSVLHFSGRAAHFCMHNWAGLLGAC